MFQKFPDTIATFLFLPAGLSFGYLFFLPWIDDELYSTAKFWPFFTMLFSIVITASIITIIKLNNGKYIFEHFSYLTAGAVLYIIGGTLFTVLRDDYTYIALFICAIANGIVTVAGLSYVNIRTEKQDRPGRFGLCHSWKMIGFAIVLTLYLNLLDDNGNPLGDTLQKFYQTLGYIMMGSSVIFLFLMAVNEFRQRQGLIYNYRDCLDHDNSIANNYCKLFSRNEVIIERNPTVSSAGLWKSTENLLPRSKQNYTNAWTIYLMLPKLHGAVMFHYLLLSLTVNESRAFVDWYLSKGITVWIMALGTIVGAIFLKFVHSAKVYTMSSIVAVTAIGVSYAFFNKESGMITIFLWIFYLAVSIATAVPDLALMEVAKIRFSEGALALGSFYEIVTIAVLQSTQRNAHELTQLVSFTEKYLLPTIVSTVVILVITSMLYQLHMPNTFDKSLLQIQNELLKYRKYFVFTFDEDVSSAVPRRSSGSNQYIDSNQHYMGNNMVNVFEGHERNISNGHANDYTEVIERLPDPPVNRVKNFDYNSDIPKAPSIIPRVNIAKSSLYSK